MVPPTVIGAVRRFLPAYLETHPGISAPQRRAIRAIMACRTGVLGGHVHACSTCREVPPRYLYHSCNHKACPQCGRGATQRWVQRQEQKRLHAPHFMVTFTVPEELRGLFFGRSAKTAFSLLFQASARALSGAMERHRQLQITRSGFTMVLHTWNQQLLFHPHVHCLVPGAGLDVSGRYRQVKSPQFLVAAAALKAAYRREFRALMAQHGLPCDPAVWRKEWAVNIQPFGNGSSAIKYLGAYISRSAIADSRMVEVGSAHVTFKWKDRTHGGRERQSTLHGIEFVRRYLRHVLPVGLHSVRYAGFHHPAARKTRLKVTLLSGKPVDLGDLDRSTAPARHSTHPVLCPCCRQPMPRIASLPPAWKRQGSTASPPGLRHTRGPPVLTA